jgi:hypothetical protein
LVAGPEGGEKGIAVAGLKSPCVHRFSVERVSISAQEGKKIRGVVPK